MTRKNRILIGLAVLVAVLVPAFLYVSGESSDAQVKRELNSFADAVESCTPFEQDYLAPMLGTTMARSVGGEGADGCALTFEGIGGDLRCTIPPQDLAEVAGIFRKRAEAFSSSAAGTTMSIDTENSAEDPMMILYNSTLCQIEG